MATCVILCGGCSESGSRKGHAGAQGSRIDEPAGAGNEENKSRNINGADYQPVRNFESSVLNEPDANSTNDAKGRGYRVSGTGYEFKR